MAKSLKKRVLRNLFWVMAALPAATRAQLILTGQLRTRTEFRNGFGTPAPKVNDAAFFVSQRTRLTLDYSIPQLKFHVSVQDVRVWGQDASTISNSDGSRLAVHEAWAELNLTAGRDSLSQAPHYFGIRLGRQELLYDDSRLLGNLDWLQQARRHDALLFKSRHGNFQADAGLAFNQNSDAFNYNGTYYTPANVNPFVKDSKGNLTATPAGMIPLANAVGWSNKAGTPSLIAPPSTNGLYQDYKAMQFLYVARTFRHAKLSGLFLADHFGKSGLDSVRNISGIDTGYVYGRRFNRPGVFSRFTLGALLAGHFGSGPWAYTAGYYFQGGHDRDGLSLSAFTATASIGYGRGNWNFLAGWDYLSGNSAFSASGQNHRFDPLYGTPHKFWGAMDYFYAGTGSPAGGLDNPFIKIKYQKPGSRWDAGLDCHYFSLAGNQKDLAGNRIDPYLGTEADLLGHYSINGFTSLEGGFSFLAASPGMEYAKGLVPGTSRLFNTWAYLMLTIKPELFRK
jgi:hypothetical protein